MREVQMEIAAFASFALLVMAWIVLPLRTTGDVPAAAASPALAEPRAA
jgi:hypothetical protein